MNICLAQTYPVRGDVGANIAQHESLIHLAVIHAADLIIFPELSLTGYEPSLARQLIFTPDDGRLDRFQAVSDQHGKVVGVGLPTPQGDGVAISLILFQPGQPRRVYGKRFLHEDELPFFVPGPNFPVFSWNGARVSLAICYELSVADHLAEAVRHDADLYIASVAKSRAGVANAGRRLAAIAKEHQMPVFMANCVGPAEDFEGGGRSAAWNDQGTLVGQLDDKRAGLLLYNQTSGALTGLYL